MRSSLRQVLFRSAAGLDLNFAGGVFSLNNTRTASPAGIPGWSFSRTDTNGTATALDLAGNVIQFPSRTNLLERSQEFDNAYWTKNNATVSANQTASPDGAVTADKIQEDTVNGVHGVSRLVTLGAGAVTFSCFVKAAERNFANIGMTDTATGDCNAVVNLTTGAVVGGSAGGSWTARSVVVTAAANGFWRVSVTGTKGASALVSPYVRTALDASTTSFAGTTGSGVFAWGAQLETGSTATAYIPTTTAAVTVVLPRITNRGILVEEARTNSIRNSACQGAVAGTPGTLPTNFVTQLAGTTRSVIGTGTDSATGLSYVDLRFSGTPSSTGLIEIKVDGNANVSGTSAGQSWTHTMYVARVGGSLTNISSASLLINEYSAGPTYLRTSTQATSVLAAGGVTTRVGGTTTLGALTTIIEPIFSLGVTSGSAIDITVRVAAPQLELGAFATSPIITTGAAGTRGAEVATVASIGSYSETTLFAEIETFAGTSAADRYATTYGTLGPGLGIRFSDGNGSAIIPGVGYPWGLARASTVTKLASRFISGNVRGTVDGSLSSQATTTWTQAGQGAAIGHNGSGISQANGYIRRIRILPTALPDAQLQALTAP